MIIRQIKFGWCSLCFDDTGAKVNASYLTDIFDDLTHMCEEYLNRKTASCYFDEEGTTSVLCLTPDEAYIIFNKNTLCLVKLKEAPEEIIKDIINDLLSHIEDMCALDIDYDTLSDEEKDRRKSAYKHRLDNLSKKI